MSASECDYCGKIKESTGLTDVGGAVVDICSECREKLRSKE